jgi:choice-of-anchor B domain-containing protein
VRKFLKYWLTAVFAVVYALAALSQPNNDSLNMRSVLHYPQGVWGTGASNINNGLWGYNDTATGKEYALVGNYRGLLITDITVPAQPVNKLWVPGVYSTWREVRVKGHYAYMVHDFVAAGSPVQDEGLLIVDLDSLNGTPRYKKMRIPVPKPTGGFDTVKRAHTLFADEKGFLYLFGSNIGPGGAVILDIGTDPWNPAVVGHYNSNYIHDGYVRNDTLYAASLWNGIVVVNCVLKSNPTVVKSFQTPNQFAHNCWLSDDGRVLYTTDEQANAFITAYDLSDWNNVTELWRYQVQPGSGIIPHNAHVKGKHLVTSYYTFGVIAQDIECPEWPVLVGYYDTSPFSGGNFHGAWSVYPYGNSGRILVNDMETGLWVVEEEWPDVTRFGGWAVIDWNQQGGPYMPWSQAGGISGPLDYVWKSNGDTLRVEADGSFRYHRFGPINDTLVGINPWGQPVELPVIKSGGTCPQDTLAVPQFWGLPEGGMPAIQVRMLPGAWGLSENGTAVSALRYALVDALGRTVRSVSNPGGNTETIAWPEVSGWYTLRVETTDGRLLHVRALRP